MSLNIPLILEGKYFTILTRTESRSNGPKDDLIFSVINRGSCKGTGINSLKLDGCSFDPDHIKNRIKDITSILGFDLAYLQIDFLGLRYISAKSVVKEYDLSTDEFIKRTRESNQIKGNDFDRFIFSTLSSPYISDPVEENLNVLKLIQYMIKDAQIHLSDNTVLILTGEMIWSRFVNSFVLINLLRFLNVGEQYIIPDIHGLWQGLLGLKNPGFLKDLDKTYLLPSILYKTYEDKKDKMDLNCSGIKRTIHLTKELDIFDINTEECFLKDKMVPRFLIINRPKKKSRDKGFIQIHTDFMKKGRVEFGLYPQNYVNTVSKEIFIPYRHIEECTKKVGEWVSVNEMIGKQVLVHSDTYNVKKNASIKVFEGQIVKKGELIASYLFKDLRCKRAGKIELSSINNGVIKVIVNTSKMPIISSFSGELVKYSDIGVRLRSYVSEIRLAGTLGEGCLGLLSKEVEDENILLCEGYPDVIRYLNKSVEKSSYYEKNIKGILVKRLKYKEFESLRSLNIPDLKLGCIDMESSNNSSFWKELENYLMNRSILISYNHLYFQSNIKEDFGEVINYNNSELDLKAGQEVFFVDFLSPNLYGNIVGPSSKGSEYYLINTGRDLVDVHINNIIWFKHGE